ncbi:MAG: DsbA family protein [Fibrobacterales bacterium]
MNKRIIVLVSVAILMACYVAGSYIYKSKQTTKRNFLAQENAQIFVPDHAITYGKADAKVYIVEFFDPACETCRQLFYSVKRLVDQSKGKVQLVMRYAPFHHGAKDIVALIEAARKQNKYWEALERLYGYQAVWASHHQAKVDLTWGYMKDLNIDIELLKKDMQDPKIAQLIQQDLADVKALNVKQTPEFFVNGQPLPHFGLDELTKLVAKEIAIQYGE